MGVASLPRRAATAFRNVGATEEMIAAARLIYGSLPNEPRGRQRIYKTAKEADHAFYMRHRDRFRENRAISPKNGHVSEPLALARKHADVIGRALDPMKDMAVAIAETIVAALPQRLKLRRPPFAHRSSNQDCVGHRIRTSSC